MFLAVQLLHPDSLQPLVVPLGAEPGSGTGLSPGLGSGPGPSFSPGLCSIDASGDVDLSGTDDAVADAPANGVNGASDISDRPLEEPMESGGSSPHADMHNGVHQQAWWPDVPVGTMCPWSSIGCLAPDALGTAAPGTLQMAEIAVLPADATPLYPSPRGGPEERPDRDSPEAGEGLRLGEAGAWSFVCLHPDTLLPVASGEVRNHHALLLIPAEVWGRRRRRSRSRSRRRRRRSLYYIHPKAHKVGQPLCDSRGHCPMAMAPAVMGITYTLAAWMRRRGNQLQCFQEGGGGDIL